PHWLGPFPFSNLTVIESDRLESRSIPGLLLINRPRQALLQKMQMTWLNWGHWILLQTLTSQWLDAYLRLEHVHDGWLLQGLSEFIVLDLLDELAHRQQLTNTDEVWGSMNLLDFSYREVQDVG